MRKYSPNCNSLIAYDELLAGRPLMPQLIAAASRSPMLLSLRLLFAVRKVFCLGFESGCSFLKPRFILGMTGLLCHWLTNNSSQLPGQINKDGLASLVSADVENNHRPVMASDRRTRIGE